VPIHAIDLFRDIAALLGLPAAALGVIGWISAQPQPQPDFAIAQTVQISAGSIDFAQPGEFLLDNRPAQSPTALADFDNGIEVMKYQVSRLDYDRCIEAGACDPADPISSENHRVPVTGVNYHDAEAYAAWYSRVTGQRWRLPTAAEWAYFAGERFGGDVFSGSDDPENPAKSWIRRYREEAERKRKPDPEPKIQGHYGANSNGVFDLAGNVWEWTSTCYVRATLAADGSVARTIDNCGVHVVEGRHRAYMSNFIRDGKSGGCAVGTPPENLGFRLVREPDSLFEIPGIS
jgi:formylglycine-generating enzyme required for sulfatase activity